MNLKVSVLYVILIAMPVLLEAQTARNPLNFEPAKVTLQKRLSSWKLAEEVFYRADGTPFDKRSHTYDENGRKITDVTLRRSADGKDWLTVMQREFRYEANTEIMTTKSGGADGQYTSKTETVSDAQGKPLYANTCSRDRDAGEWSGKPCLKSEWEYDAQGRVTACLKRYTNSESNNPDSRILYSYDEDGALSEEVFQSWNPQQEQWTNRGRYTYTNDSEQQKTAVSAIYVSDNWVFDGKTVYSYDPEGKLIRCDYYRDNTAKTFDAYSLYTYTEGDNRPLEVVRNEAHVSPNPVISSFELTVSDGLLGNTMWMFDVSGNQVKAIPVNNLKTQVEVYGLPSGVYVLKIGDVTTRIIVK